MKKLNIPYINIAAHLSPFEAISPIYAIDIAPWSSEKENPTVHFGIGHDGQNIFLIYSVQESAVVAKTTTNNGPVWQDSCVEFFIMPENDGIFYNFEFNCIGAKLLYAGKNRQERTPASDAIINQVILNSTLGKEPFDEKTGYFDWTLTAIIPISCFFQHKIETLKGKNSKANFYKCGDGLSKPHYLAWSNIKTPTPDFHTPQYFGEIRFE
ncbi:MAG: hypothetical protein JNL70_06685 [Saprospiraceae bacterium]|nr:hypothetical protein [Saprospiraceae bacterium]